MMLMLSSQHPAMIESYYSSLFESNERNSSIIRSLAHLFKPLFAIREVLIMTVPLISKYMEYSLLVYVLYTVILQYSINHNILQYNNTMKYSNAQSEHNNNSTVFP